MNDLTKVASTELTDELAAELLSGIAESRQSTILTGGKPFLRLLKSGEWVYGQTNEEVQDGSQWAVNIFTLGHGYACWIDSELRGEAMISMSKPKPQKPPPVDGIAYKEQRSFELKCLNGDDAGVEVLYKTTSDGGLKAVDALLVQIQRQLATDRQFAFPVMTLGDEYYQHQKYGRIYKPVMTVVGWADTNGNMAGKASKRVAAAPVAQPQPEPATPAKPKKASLKAVPASPEPPPAPEVVLPPADPLPTQQARTGQRRRPAAR
jgi:hypothetical protein